MKKLWKSLCLAICLALCMIPLGEISIEAKVTPSLQDRTANFSRNYTLTTDPGTNMVRIAQAQIGKTYADLGYSEAWCANFVSDCARLASQTAAVPAHAFVPTFSQLIRSAGGTVVVGQSVISTPKAGDIIFYGTIDYPNMYENEWHVGLVSGYSNGEIYTIEGNANGSNTNNYDGKVVASRASWSSFPYYYVLRPNYSGSTPQPTKATINIHANGGIEKTKSITVTYGNKCNLSTNFVLRNGYKLKGWNLYRPADNKWFATGKGWYTASEIASKGYQKHLYIPNLSMELESSWYANNSSSAAITNFTFYAIWEPTANTININANGGTTNTSSISVVFGNKFNLSPSFVTRNGYKLKGWNLYRPVDNKWFATGKGWYTASEIASKGYQKHLYIPNLFMGLENSWYGNNSSNAAITNFTFYAIWEPTANTININANGGTTNTSSISVVFGNKFNLSPSFVTRNGYKLKGWNLYRPVDNKWFATGKGWYTASEIASKGYQKHLYIPNLFMGLENSWYGNNSSNAAITNFTFYAIWEIEDIDTNTCSPIASTKYNGKIYELYDNATSWNTANTAATKLGGYLACITSSSENAAIHNLIKSSGSKNCYWIGGSNLNDSQNKFHWVSGESFTYTNWAEKEPSLGTEHFIMMYKSNGLWNDLPVEGTNYDSGNMGFIVEKNAPTINFSDVTADAWYVSYVYDLAGKGIINGITPTTFDPEGKITRGQFVKILAYASGDDLSAYGGDSVFADANAHWSKANINWAYTNKIVYGKSDTQFAPDANITRQEMAVMIKRYADYKGITLPKTNAPITFTDEAEIAAWAKEAVSAMQQANIISGFPDGTFSPQGNATRAQAAKMISVFLSL